MECIFCKSINKEIPSKIVYEDDVVIGILDIYPATLGHILLIPKEHKPNFSELDEKIVNHLGIIASRLSLLLVTNLKAQGISLVIKEGVLGGQRSSHTLMHIIPRFENDSLNFDLLGGEEQKGKQTKTNKLYEDKEIIVVEYPTLTEGHIAILPKEEFSIIMKVPEIIIGKMFLLAQKFVKKIVSGEENNNNNNRKRGANIVLNTGIDQPQQTVSLHVIPREEGDDFDFVWDVRQVDDKSLDEIVDKFKGNVKKGVEEQIEERRDNKKEEQEEEGNKDSEKNYYNSYLDRLP